MAFPLGTVESLRSTFIPARRVDLAAKLPLSSSDKRKPLHASVTFWEAHRSCLPEIVPWPLGPDTRHVYFTEPISETMSRSYAFCAVHRGFGRRLLCHQSPVPGYFTPFVRRHPFSRSYGTILPNSLKRVVLHP
ncbi:hypothetical protein V6N13_142827 [Hibiscus sabdariffa]